MWLVSSVLIGALAVHRHDAVFILLQVSSLASAAAILVLGHRYRGLVCETHLHTLAEQWPVAAVDGSQGGVARRR